MGRDACARGVYKGGDFIGGVGKVAGGLRVGKRGG